MVEKVSTKEVITYGSGKYKIVLVDLGVKSEHYKETDSKGDHRDKGAVELQLP
jgi:hypothetical protein